MLIQYYWSKVLKKIRGVALKDSQIHKTSKVESGSSLVNTFMDKHSFCGYNCEITNCRIGSYTSIANGVVIGGGMHPVDWVGMSPVFYEGRDSVRAKFSHHVRPTPMETTIGHDVWIGQNVLIKQGISIGHGAVIGMGSVVTKDIPPYAIAAGNPARIIRMRFDEQTVEKLLKIEWWNFSDDKLQLAATSFKSVDEFLKQV